VARLLSRNGAQRWFSLDRPLAGDHRERLQVWPALGGVQAVELVEDVAAPDFQPAMILLDDFVELVWRLAWCRLEGADEIADRFGQGGLIVLDRQDIVGPRSRMACAMLGCVPMASMVTMQPSRAKVASSSGMAVFSFDFAAVARCPRTRPAWAANALTRCKGVAPLSRPTTRLAVDGDDFAVRQPGTTWPTQRRKAAANSSGSIAAKTRPNVSWQGMPCSSFRYFRSQSSFSFAQASISTKVSAPDRTAQTGHHQQLHQVVLDLRRLPWVAHAHPDVDQPNFSSASMEIPKKTENYTNQRAVNSPFA
jgi:hypothetical protein